MRFVYDFARNCRVLGEIYVFCMRFRPNYTLNSTTSAQEVEEGRGRNFKQ